MKKMLLTLGALVAFGICSAATAAQLPASSQSTATMSGRLTFKDHKFFLTDEATHTTVEVRGEGLKKHVGRKVNLTGELTAGQSGSPQILTISGVDRAAAAGSSKAAAAGVKSGLSKAAVVGMAGAGTAATVGTLYAADVIGDEETSVSRQ